MIPQQATVPTLANTKANLGISLLPKNDGGFVHSQDHVYMLSNEERDEVKAAMQHFKALGLDGDKISPTSFPLPTLKKLLCTLTAELHHGRGFFVLRGLDPHELSSEDAILRYLGISSYVADEIAVQDEYKNVFAHIRDAKYSTASQEDRPVRDSTLASSFHTDEACNIIAMHTSGLAAEGGNHIVAPSSAVYEDLCETRPDVIPTLIESNWYFDTCGRLAQTQGRAILYKQNDHIIFNFNRQALQGVPGIEPHNLQSCLTDLQREALDAVEASARRVQLPLEAELGDISFVNNFTTLHAREGFHDSPLATRHLVRMWLKNSQLAYVLPPPLAELNERLFDKSIRRNWNILPKARLTFTIKERLSP